MATTATTTGPSAAVSDEVFEFLERVLGGMRRAWAAGERWEDTFPLRGGDGDYRWFLTRAVPVRDALGRPVLWFGTNTDVTSQPM